VELPQKKRDMWRKYLTPIGSVKVGARPTLTQSQ